MYDISLINCALWQTFGLVLTKVDKHKHTVNKMIISNAKFKLKVQVTIFFMSWRSSSISFNYYAFRRSSSCSEGRKSGGRICGGVYKVLLDRIGLMSAFRLVSSRLRPASREPWDGLGCPTPKCRKLVGGVLSAKLFLGGDWICVLKGLDVERISPLFDLIDAVVEAAGRGKKSWLLEQSMSSFHWQTLLTWSNKVPLGQANDLFSPVVDPSSMQMWKVRHSFFMSA